MRWIAPRIMSSAHRALLAARSRLSRRYPRGHAPAAIASPSTAGFTLLETLVSFTILTLFLTIIFVGLSQVLLGDRRADLSRQALRLAQSKLDEIGIIEPLSPGETMGRLEDGFSWRAVVKPVRAGHVPEARGFWVEVTVSAPLNAVETPAQVTLTTLKIAGRRS
ncbi:type IV pilus modification PilV family protein [Bradyrhizobium brasilense]|uniref:Type II secretion system protein n=1 Tax=Bradyrhizobium brasilense TaxID=1419277 RepID=A0ABY8JNE4_9BRAD|nr:type II secretion system protein [Bradyrhizobium brasilense]WFU66689.1 type II secretion system protein [Bradyrhizobium brasilense]